MLQNKENKMKKSIGASPMIYPTPALVVGSYDNDGKPNVMTAAYGGVCCGKPPCINVCLRAATYSHKNIMGKMAYTVSIAPEKYAKEMDFFGMASGRDVDKFAATGLTPIKSDVVDAPYVEEFPVVIECKVKEVVELGLHTMFVGEVMDIKADEDALHEKTNKPAMEIFKPVIFDMGTSSYFGPGENLGRAFGLGKSFMKG